MPPKAKKKVKKGLKKKKAAVDGEEEKKDENAEFRVTLPTYGWIKIKVSLVPHQLTAITSTSNGVSLICSVTVMQCANPAIQLVRYLYANVPESPHDSKTDRGPSR